MKKKILLMCVMIAALICLLAITAFAETAYVNSKGEQVEAGNSDIAYEIAIDNPWHTTGNCSIRYIYLYDTSVTKIVIPAIKLTHSNGTVYDMSTYDYVRLSTGWNGTLSLYSIDDKETKSNSFHTQIKELEFHVPVLGDGASSSGNLAGWSSLEKLSFYSRAYEPQSKGGFLSGCTSLKEIHFYGANNHLTANFFPSTMVAGGKIVFHESATGVITGCAMQNINGKDVTVYLNTIIQPKDTTDPRLTWNKNSNGLLKFVLLVNDKSIYTAEQIASYETTWQAGNKTNANNAKYSMPIKTFCEFYGNHTNMNALSSCVAKCLTCNVVAAPANPIHNLDIVINYTDYTVIGVKTTRCLNDSCSLNVTPSVEDAPALFACDGYSIPEDNRTGISVNYIVNKNAMAEYKAVNSDFEYGVFAVLESKIGTSEIFKEDGTLTTNSVCANLTNKSHAAVTLKILGFTTEEHKTLGLAMGIYVKETVESQAKYTYIQPASPEEGQKYSFISYNGIPQ